MKNILMVCFTILFFGSCGDGFLDHVPETNTNQANFYKTETHFDQAVIGAYGSMRGISNMGYVMGEMRSDNTHYTHNVNERMSGNTYREDMANFLVSSQNYNVSHIWTTCYDGISQANIILGRIEGADLSAEFKSKTIGQAKFIRAFLYFELVQCFARVPLQLKEVKNASDAFPLQNSVDEVYAQIIDDVKDAIEKLDVVSFSGDNKLSSGMGTKGAAKMLYAYVLMTQPTRDYPTAEAQLKEVVGQMGYDLMPKYTDVFDLSKKNSVEHIFSIQYQKGNQGQDSDWLYSFMPRIKEGKIITGVPFSDTASSGGWNVPTKAMIDSYEAGDERLDPSIAVAVGKYEEGNNTIIVEDVLKVGDPKISNYGAALPFVNKYRHAHEQTFNTDDNWPIYRYADALLLLSECLVEQGRAGEAAPHINRVRKRAGLLDLTNVTAEAVANERKHELAFENHRWYDLVRTGKAIEVMAAYGKYIKGIDTNISVKAYNVKKENLILPIPFREMQINVNLTQNAGSEAQ